jgi:hypothetical protein
MLSQDIKKQIDLKINEGSNIDDIEKVKGEIDALNKELNNITNQKEKAIKMTIEGILSEEDIKSTVTTLNNKKQTIEEKLYSKQDELEYLKESESDLKNMKGELSTLRKDIPFDRKQETLQKYIRRIYIQTSTTDTIYEVRIVYKTKIEESLFVINKSFGMVRTIYPYLPAPIDSDFIKTYGIPESLEIVGEYSNTTFRNKMIERINNYQPQQLDKYYKSNVLFSKPENHYDNEDAKREIVSMRKAYWNKDIENAIINRFGEDADIEGLKKKLIKS